MTDLTSVEVLGAVTEVLLGSGFEVGPELSLSAGTQVRCFEDPVSIVGIVQYQSWSELHDGWIEAQSILVDLLSQRLDRSDPKSWEGYLVLLTLDQPTDPAEVDEILQRLGAQGDELVSPPALRLPAPAPLRELLTEKLALSKPTRRFIEVLAEKATSHDEKARLAGLLAPESKDMLTAVLEQREFVRFAAGRADGRDQRTALPRRARPQRADALQGAIHVISPRPRARAGSPRRPARAAWPRAAHRCVRPRCAHRAPRRARCARRRCCRPARAATAGSRPR